MARPSFAPVRYRVEHEMAYICFLISELGFQIKDRRLWTDSMANKCAVTRFGPGKMMRHLNAAEMYLQENVQRKEIRINKIKGTKNPSNVLTKHVPADILNKHFCPSA